MDNAAAAWAAVAGMVVVNVVYGVYALRQWRRWWRRRTAHKHDVRHVPVSRPVRRYRKLTRVNRRPYGLATTHAPRRRHDDRALGDSHLDAVWDTSRLIRLATRNVAAHMPRLRRRDDDEGHR